MGKISIFYRTRSGYLTYIGIIEVEPPDKELYSGEAEELAVVA
jgi:hypothetical protein